MAGKDDMPLFDRDALLSDAQFAAEQQAARRPGDGAADPDLDAARLWRSRDDGLLVRGVKPHSAEKSLMVSRAIETVSSAMHGKWFVSTHGLEYVELYSGPGRLLNERSGLEQPGSPIEALAVPKPFTRYVFSDYSSDCTDALTVRVGGRRDTTVICGNANDTSHLSKVTGFLNPRALVIAYVDPARPQDLKWTTIEYLARFDFIDLIVNLPVNSILRAILGHYRGGGTGPGKAGLLLNHSNPRELLLPSPDRYHAAATINAIRRHFDEQVMSLGFLQPARRTVHFPADNPYYDVLYASRHPTGVALWDRTNPEPDDPQMSLLT